MGTESNPGTAVAPPSTSELVRRGGAALAVAVVANVAFVLVADLAGVANGFEAYRPFIVARGSAIGVVGATLVYWLARRFGENPDRLFTIVAAVVYGIGLLPVVFRAPTMPGATTLGVALLPVMHAVVAVPCVAFLTGRVSVP